ncbi:MAG: sigma-70 family RNA polymerase sigma factor [Acidimicrobiia bacterium]
MLQSVGGIDTTAAGATAGDDREALVVGAYWLARRVVEDVAARVPRSVDRQDLHSAALVGLVNAARIFDPALGVPFDAFARARMRWAVLDELRAHDPLSRSERRTATALSAIVGEPRDLGAVRRCRDRSARLVASDVDREVEALDAADPSAVSPESHAIERELVEAVRGALVLLPTRCRSVVVAYFIEGRAMRSIADELGVTPSRVSQLCTEGVRRLRAVLDSADAGRVARTVRSA